MRTRVVWLRRDLRTRDHPALRTAAGGADAVIPVFCLDDRLLHGRHGSGPRTGFLLECLEDLGNALHSLGSALVVRHGQPEDELPALAKEVGAEAVHFSADVGPFARRRDERVRRSLEAADIAAHAHPGVAAVHDLAEIRTRDNRPYAVFSPFHRTWLEQPRRDVLGGPRKLPPLPRGIARGRLPSLQTLGFDERTEDRAQGGEGEGRRALDRFLGGPVHHYVDNHDALGRDRTSRLSPYLHFGCITPRQIEERLPRGKAAEAFRRQLCWRDFYGHVLLHNPRNARSEFQDRYRGRITWSYAKRPFEAWCKGRTGYPLVDAGMRQLRAEGWMHNRARLVVGSFLTKDLGIDWRWGERWFMRWLIDGDEANNNGNWQWIASVGVDPQPAFRRIYNPTLHMARYDPEGRYVRRYVPELRAVPDEYLREPWTMPEEMQRECRCILGEDYPRPIVDRKLARADALDRYRL